MTVASPALSLLRFCGLCWLLLGASLVFGQVPPGYRLVWAEEFDGTTLDTSKFDHRAPGPRRQGVNVPEAVTLDGQGLLSITTRKVGNAYHTGMIGTQGRAEFLYGYFEARMELQKEQGHWPAFWMQSPTIGNPIGNTAVAGVEVDIMEYHSRWGDSLQHALHWDGYGPEHKFREIRPINVSGVSTGFHTFGCEWTPDAFIFYVNGRETARTSVVVSRRTHYLILSLEVDSWPGDISQAALPDGIRVDYVRVYQKNVASPPVTLAGGQTPTLRWRSTRGWQYRTLVSSNLSDWLPLTDWQNGTDAVLSYTPPERSDAALYYRVEERQP